MPQRSPGHPGDRPGCPFRVRSARGPRGADHRTDCPLRPGWLTSQRAVQGAPASGACACRSSPPSDRRSADRLGDAVACRRPRMARRPRRIDRSRRSRRRRRPAAAAAAPLVASVAGSLQSELGCAADWDPSCDATDLVDNGDGTSSASFTLPGGQLRVQDRHQRRRGTRTTVRAERSTAATSRSFWRPRPRSPSRSTTPRAWSSMTPDRAAARAPGRRRRPGPRQPARRPQPRAVLLRDGGPLRELGPGQRHRRLRHPARHTGRRRAADHRFRPDRQGLLPRRGHQRHHREARLPQGSRDHRGVDDAVVQEQAGAGRGCGPQRRVPRLLDHRLHADRSRIWAPTRT